MNLDMDSGICNGSQGVIIDVTQSIPAYPVVKFSNGLIKTIQPQFRQSDEYPTIAIGQVPLMLAWALTIHKIQGATLEMADIDVGTNIFEYGQTYVALSRVQSLDGLYLTAFNPGRIRANESVRAFYSQLPNIDYCNSQPIEENSTVKKIRL
jgi:ATP-dependent DNA helicase PIF1